MMMTLVRCYQGYSQLQRMMVDTSHYRRYVAISTTSKPDVLLKLYTGTGNAFLSTANTT